MIMFNEQSRPVVWINQNLSLNDVEVSSGKISSSFYNLSSVSEPQLEQVNNIRQYSFDCVNRLMEIVENKTKDGFPGEFKRESVKVETYFELQNFIAEYAERKQITIPDRVFSLGYR